MFTMYDLRYLIIYVTLFLLSCSEVPEDLDPQLPCDPVNPEVPATGDPALGWVTPVSDGTNIEHRVFCSGAAQTEVSYHIYIPEVYYTEPDRQFPVMYWLHGGGPGPGIYGIPFLSDYFNNAIDEGLIPPMLIVFPNSPVRPAGNFKVISMWVDSHDKKSPVETMLIKELVPHIDATYRTIASGEGRALDGFSMGGYGAARLGFKYNDIFSAISILGAGPMQPMLLETPRMTDQAREALLRVIYGGSQDYFVAVSPKKMAEENVSDLKENMFIRIAVGDLDETYNDNMKFHEYLTQLGIPHEFITGDGVTHNLPQLLNFLGEDNWEFYRKVFE